jgi:hypothetical protein
MGEELAIHQPAPPPSLFGTDQPGLIIQKASSIATVLKGVIRKQKLAMPIGGKEYILVEGWTTLGALVGVFPRVESTARVLDGDGDHIGWEAAVTVTTTAGVEIGRAEAQCLRTERNWKNRDDFALRSMAQTRAMGKALRMPLGWIAVLGGYEATPAEEMPVEEVEVPFESGPVQDPTGDDPTQEGASGTGGAGTLEQRRQELTGLLLAEAERLGETEDTTGRIVKNQKLHADDLEAHVAWLEKYLNRSKAKTAA